MSLADFLAESFTGTIWSSSPCMTRVGTSIFLRSSVKSVSEKALMWTAPAFVDTRSLSREEEFTMPKSHVPYPPEFKRRLVEMVRAGRNPEELAEKFEPTAQSIRNWVAQRSEEHT